jgi:hypothetical protein
MRFQPNTYDVIPSGLALLAGLGERPSHGRHYPAECVREAARVRLWGYFGGISMHQYCWDSFFTASETTSSAINRSRLR